MARRPVASPRRVADWCVAAVLCTLFALPAILLVTGDKPTPYGFQMYSGYGTVAATWRDHSGVEHAVALDEHLAVPRHEVRWPQFLPEALCRRIDDAVSVEVERVGEDGTTRRRATC